MIQSIEDRALSEHRGSGIFTKKANGKYSIFLPVEGTGENGSTPNQLDKTAIGNKQASSVEGRQDNPQKNLPFFAHRDNITILEDAKGKTLEFLRVLPDFTAFKYSGTVTYMINNTDVGNLEQGQLTITPTTGDTYVENCYGLIEDTAVITNSIPEVVEIDHSATNPIEVVNITTDPADASVSVVSSTGAVASATYSSSTGSITITGLTAGSTIVTITVSKSNYATFKRTILVIVK